MAKLLIISLNILKLEFIFVNSENIYFLVVLCLIIWDYLTGIAEQGLALVAVQLVEVVPSLAVAVLVEAAVLAEVVPGAEVNLDHVEGTK